MGARALRPALCPTETAAVLFLVARRLRGVTSIPPGPAMPQRPQPTTKAVWHRAAPWILTTSSVIVLTALAFFLMENIWWFRQQALHDGPSTPEHYRIYVFHLHLSMIKRSVGLFAGFALIFVG